MVGVGRRAARLQLHLDHLLLRFHLLEVSHVSNVVRASLDPFKLQQRPGLPGHRRHLQSRLDVNLVLGVGLVAETRDEEEGGGEEEDHEGGAGLALPQPPVHHDLVQASQLGRQSLVLRLKCIDFFLKMHKLAKCGACERISLT